VKSRLSIRECPIALGGVRLCFRDRSVQLVDLGVQRGNVGRTTLGV